MGAGAGAVIGHQQGKGIEGAVIGGVVGGVLGNVLHKDHRCHSRCNHQSHRRGHQHGHHHRQHPHHEHLSQYRQYFIDGHGCKVYVDEYGHYRGCSVINPYKRRTYYNPLHD
jgi:uncharacterized protein YcfJ